MQDRPTALELLAAVRGFLEHELAPSVEDAFLRYQLLIAIHALEGVERELTEEGARLEAELEALHRLLGRPAPAPAGDLGRLRGAVLDANRELCQRIRRGDADQGPWRQRVLGHLAAVVEEKLRISNPALLARLVAEEPEAG